MKFFFIEGGEQFIVGAQTAKMIGLKSTLRITLAGFYLQLSLSNYPMLGLFPSQL
jgi:hypothetical protein